MINSDVLVEERVHLASERPQPVDGWEHLAACKGADPDLFFPDINGSSRAAYREAERICKACEVRQQCLDDALASDDRWGMRGGVTPRARARMRRGTAPADAAAERKPLNAAARGPEWSYAGSLGSLTHSFPHSRTFRTFRGDLKASTSSVRIKIRKRDQLMGLDFSHCDAHWSYSGFHRFRHRLAQAEGFDLDQMAGFTDWSTTPRTAGMRSWDEISSPLEPLLNHSDCDGTLTPAECAQVIPRLKEIISGWDEGRLAAEELIRGMEACIRDNEELEFC